MFNTWVHARILKKIQERYMNFEKIQQKQSFHPCIKYNNIKKTKLTNVNFVNTQSSNKNFN